MDSVIYTCEAFQQLKTVARAPKSMKQTNSDKIHSMLPFAARLWVHCIHSRLHLMVPVIRHGFDFGAGGFLS